MNQTKIIIRMDSGNCLEAVCPNFEDAVDELKISKNQLKLNVLKARILYLQTRVYFAFLRLNQFLLKGSGVIMTKTIIKNVYPVDNYVYELKFKTYSKYYQDVHDAFKEKYRNPERSMIIRHPLNFTSSYYQELEGKSLALGDEPMDGSYLVDKFSDDVEPKHSKLKQILLACFHGAYLGMFLVLLVLYINEVFNL